MRTRARRAVSFRRSDGATSAAQVDTIVHMVRSAIRVCACCLLLLLVTASDWRLLVWVRSNAE